MENQARRRKSVRKQKVWKRQSQRTCVCVCVCMRKSLRLMMRRWEEEEADSRSLFLTGDTRFSPHSETRLQSKYVILGWSHSPRWDVVLPTSGTTWRLQRRCVGWLWGYNLKPNYKWPVSEKLIRSTCINKKLDSTKRLLWSAMSLHVLVWLNRTECCCCVTEFRSSDPVFTPGEKSSSVLCEMVLFKVSSLKQMLQRLNTFPPGYSGEYSGGWKRTFLEITNWKGARANGAAVALWVTGVYLDWVWRPLHTNRASWLEDFIQDHQTAPSDWFKCFIERSRHVQTSRLSVLFPWSLMKV